jgi:ferredoxin--NADP+ reductase
VAVVGVGNVAVDVCRILARTPDELAQTDIADHALAALRRSQVKEIYMLGRRGPAQAAFTNPELRELGELIGADIYVRPEEAELDPLSRAALLKAPDKNTQKKVELVQAYAQKAPTGKPRKLVLRFLVSPVELIGDGQGRVTAIRLVRNVLTEGPDGSLRPRATSEHEVLPVSLVFRSVGYFGVALPGVPFDARKGVIPNERGRVRDPAQGVVLGEYTAGWIKRGPSGVIGTNKPDAKETVDRMLEDVELGQVLQPEAPGGIEPLLRERGIRFVSYRDWQHLNELEVARGKPEGRPRVKLTAVEEMLKALERGQA